MEGFGMATRGTLRTRVGIRTKRSELTNFATIVNESFDEFLSESSRQHNYREMRNAGTISLSAGDYSGNLPSASLTGFSSSVHQILTASVRHTGGSGFSNHLIIRPYEWLEHHFPDRTRSDAIRQPPVYASRFQSTLHVQSPVTQTETIHMVTTHLASSWNDSDELAIPCLEQALVAFGMYSVYEAIEAYDIADRWLLKAFGYRAAAILSEEKDPVTIQKADPRGSVGAGVGTGYRFNLSDLQALYPGDVL